MLYTCHTITHLASLHLVHPTDQRERIQSPPEHIPFSLPSPLPHLSRLTQYLPPNTDTDTTNACPLPPTPPLSPSPPSVSRVSLAAPREARV